MRTFKTFIELFQNEKDLSKRLEILQDAQDELKGQNLRIFNNWAARQMIKQLKEEKGGNE